MIVKYAEHFRTRNERDMTVRFQERTSHIRPLIDEVELCNGKEWPALVLQWLDDDLLHSCRQKLSRAELKRVSKGILLALDALHADGFVHTGIVPR